MTSLRRRMTEDMQVRNLSLQTQATYVQQVSLFARHFNKSPEILGPEEIRSYQVYLTNERKLAPSSIIIAVAALRFLYKITLHRAWNLEEVIPTPKKPQKLPVVLTQEEVRKFLASVRSVKHRTILTTCYAAGLRVSEAINVAIFPNRSHLIPYGTPSPSICWKPVPTCAPFKSCWVIAALRPPPSISASPLPRCVRPRVRSICTRHWLALSRSRLPTPRAPENGSPAV